ncbi:MAG: hypothetical protein AB7U23_11230 [Dehalococcoidia bacterium]
MQDASREPRDVREFLERDPDPVVTHVRRAAGMGRLAFHEQEDVGQEVRVRLLELERDGVGPAPGSPLAAWHDRCRRVVDAVSRGVRRAAVRRQTIATSTARGVRGASATDAAGGAHDRDDRGLSALAAVLADHGYLLRSAERRAFDALALRWEIGAVAAELGETHRLVAVRLRRGAIRMAGALRGQGNDCLPSWLLVAAARDARRRAWPAVWRLGVRQGLPARQVAHRSGLDERSVRRLLAAWTGEKSREIADFQDVGPAKPGQILFRGGP